MSFLLFLLFYYLIMKYNIKFEHNFPTYKDFSKLGVQLAYPQSEFIMKIICYDDSLFTITLNIDGHYFFCGNYNYEIRKIKAQINGNYNKLKYIDSVKIDDDVRNILKGTILLSKHIDEIIKILYNNMYK